MLSVNAKSKSAKVLLTIMQSLKVTQLYKGNFGKDNYEMPKATRGGI